MSSVAGGLTVPGLDGAAVIVTGGGSGIGAATARQLGLAGAAVVLVGRRESLLKDVAGGITADGGRALCLVNNAGTIQHRPLGEWDTSGRGVPLAGQPGAARPDRRPGGGGPVDRAAAEPLASFMTGAVIPLDGGQVIDRE